MNVHDARGTIAELGRKRPSDQRQAVHKPRIEFLTKTADAFWKENVIDPVLEIRVLATDMELAERVLSHAR